jgi:hypothetical protein
VLYNYFLVTVVHCVYIKRVKFSQNYQSSFTENLLEYELSQVYSCKFHINRASVKDVDIYKYKMGVKKSDKTLTGT